MEALLTLDNAVFSAYLFYATLAILKTLVCANVVIPLFRVTGHVFLVPEDYSAFSTSATKGSKTASSRIDTLRRMVANDLENIIPFAILGLLYVCIQPPAAIAVWHFRVHVGFRFLHTFAYALGMQPTRFLCFLPASLVNFSMAAQILRAVATL